MPRIRIRERSSATGSGVAAPIELPPRVWLPALVRAGLLGQVIDAGPHRCQAVWPTEGVEWSAEFTTEREAVACGGQDRRWIAFTTCGTRMPRGWSRTASRQPVQRVMGHEQASTTLNRYTHTPADYAARVLDAFTLPADDLLTPAAEPPSEPADSIGEPL
jgi:hypothetical protein